MKVKGASDGMVSHKIELLNLLSPGQSIRLTVDYALTEYLVPLPKEIVQADNQYVKIFYLK